MPPNMSKPAQFGMMPSTYPVLGSSVPQGLGSQQPLLESESEDETKAHAEETKPHAEAQASVGG